MICHFLSSHRFDLRKRGVFCAPLVNRNRRFVSSAARMQSPQGASPPPFVLLADSYVRACEPSDPGTDVAPLRRRLRHAPRAGEDPAMDANHPTSETAPAITIVAATTSSTRVFACAPMPYIPWLRAKINITPATTNPTTQITRPTATDVPTADANSSRTHAGRKSHLGLIPMSSTATIPSRQAEPSADESTESGSQPAIAIRIETAMATALTSGMKSRYTTSIRWKAGQSWSGCSPKA